MRVHGETQSNAEIATRSPVCFDVKPFGGIDETQRRPFRDVLGLGVLISAPQQYLMKLAKHVELTTRHGIADGRSFGTTCGFISKGRRRLIAYDKVTLNYSPAECPID